MKKSGMLLAALTIGLLMLLPSAAWAQMGHHGGKTHMHKGSHHHMEMNEHHDGMDEICKNYFAIQQSLASDSLEGISDKAKALAETAEEFHHDFTHASMNEHHDDMSALVTDIGTTARSLADKKDIDSARNEFGTLSEMMMKYHKMHADEHSEGVHAFACDLAKKVWLQQSKEPRNPYYGSAMLTCARKLQ